MKILLSAGPTLEPIDEVRYISNRSSGKMGVAIAKNAIKRGHQVSVVHGKLEVQKGNEGHWYQIETSAEMLKKMLELLPKHDVVIMAAAVCDMAPISDSNGKKDKSELNTIHCRSTLDIAYELSKANLNIFKIVFSLESQVNVERSMKKLNNKKADWVVCNEIPSMGADNSHFFVMNKEGVKVIGDINCSKAEFADHLIRAIESRE